MSTPSITISIDPNATINEKNATELMTTLEVLGWKGHESSVLLGNSVGHKYNTFISASWATEGTFFGEGHVTYIHHFDLHNICFYQDFQLYLTLIFHIFFYHIIHTYP